MRVSVSNLAFGPELREAAYARLAAAGAQGVEVAPTRLAPWEDLTPALCRTEAGALARAGLEASSLQAILFGKSELQLLKGAESFRDLLKHIRLVAEYGEALGARVAVFGAPRNRNRGERPLKDAEALAEERFWALGQAVAPFGLVLGLEPVPAYYGGDFLQTAEEVNRMVRRVDHPHIRLHLDTGCVMLGGGSIAHAIEEGADVLAHFHAAEPDLGPYETPASPHPEAAEALCSVGYDGWVAIEMAEAPKAQLEQVDRAVAYVLSTYGPGRLAAG